MKKISLIILYCVNIFLIGVFWWTSTGNSILTSNSSGILMTLGRLAGLLTAYSVLVQFILIGRVPWIERVVGFDKLTRIHKRNGYLVIGLLLTHITFLTMGYASTNHVSLVYQFLDFVYNFHDVADALIGGLILLGIGFMSLAIIRLRLQYETWYLIHLSVYIAIFEAFSHQLSTGTDFAANGAFVIYWYILYIFVIGNFILFRFGRPLYYYYRHRFFITHTAKETADTTSIYISGHHMSKLPARAGQFIIIRLLSKEFWWQAHPFSISAIPDGNSIRVTIKDKGDYTHDIQQVRPGTRVLIDGPHGIFTAKLAKTHKILCLAAGIGITPIRALTEDLIKNNHDVVLLYGNHDQSKIIFKDELKRLAQDKNFKVFHILSNDSHWSGPQGHITLAQIQKLVPDFEEREIFLCGPTKMMRSLTADLHAHNFPQAIYFEDFSLA